MVEVFNGTNVYQVLAAVVVTGLSAAAIKKGVDLVGFLWSLLPGVPEGAQLPGKARAALALAIALVAPPLCYGLLLVDSGLVKFSFEGLLNVAGVSFAAAWGWYQREKYGGAGAKGLVREGGT